MAQASPTIFQTKGCHNTAAHIPALHVTPLPLAQTVLCLPGRQTANTRSAVTPPTTARNPRVTTPATKTLRFALETRFATHASRPSTTRWILAGGQTSTSQRPARARSRRRFVAPSIAPRTSPAARPTTIGCLCTVGYDHVWSTRTCRDSIESLQHHSQWQIGLGGTGRGASGRCLSKPTILCGVSDFG